MFIPVEDRVERKSEQQKITEQQVSMLQQQMQCQEMQDMLTAFMQQSQQ